MLKIRAKILKTSLAFAACLVFSSGAAFSQESAGLLLRNAAREEKASVAAAKYRDIIEKFPGTDEYGEALLALADLDYLSGNFVRAHSGCADFAAKFPKHRSLASVYYRMGMCSLAEGDFGAAEDEFRNSIQANAWSEYAVYSKAGIADACFGRGDYRRAANEYKWIFPNEELEPHVLYMTWLCYKKMDVERYAGSSADELKRKYPKSIEAKLLGVRVEPAGPAKPAKPAEIEAKPAQPETVPVPEKEAAQAVPERSPQFVAETATINLSGAHIWAVQVGSFLLEDNALVFMAHLKGKNYDPWMQKVSIGDDCFYRVYTGKFNDEKKAREYAKKLAEINEFPAHVMKIK